jgi:hypothetical protein
MMRRFISGGYSVMKKSSVFFFALFGVLGILMVPGIGLGFDSGHGNTIIVYNPEPPNPHGTAGPEWSVPTPVDGHGDSQVFNGWQGNPQVFTGMVLTWTGDSSTLPAGVSFNIPFSGQSVAAVAPGSPASSLGALLSSSYGSEINDLVEIGMGISKITSISHPVNSLLPFMTGSALNSNDDPVLQKLVWNNASNVYNLYQVVVTQEQAVTIPGQSGTFTPYTPQAAFWPGWDPTVEDPASFAPGGYPYPDYNGKPVDYINPKDWAQWTYGIQNDCPTSVPEPDILLLLGSGLMALGGIRRVIKK